MRPVLTLLRRALTAVGLAGIVAAILRVRGSGGVPPQSGGWRELTDTELADTGLRDAALADVTRDPEDR